MGQYQFFSLKIEYVLISSRGIVVYYTGNKNAEFKMEEKKCPVCDKPIRGRTDKKFCDPSCKSAFHYQALLEEGRGFYVRVDRQLKTNRRILKRFNKAGKATVRAEVLIAQGLIQNSLLITGKILKVRFTFLSMNLDS